MSVLKCLKRFLVTWLLQESRNDLSASGSDQHVGSHLVKHARCGQVAPCPAVNGQDPGDGHEELFSNVSGFSVHVEETPQAQNDNCNEEQEDEDENSEDCYLTPFGLQCASGLWMGGTTTN